MAVAAYASLRSLMQVLDNVQHPFRRRQLRLDTDRVQSLQEKLQFLVDFLELHSQRMSQEMVDLAGQIVAAADEAEDVIDAHVVDQLREGSEDGNYHLAVISSFCQDIDKVTEKIDSITKELMMIEEEWGNAQEQKPVVSNLPASSTTLPSSGKNTMIGFDEHLLRVMDELTRDESNLQILPLVGMGGTGKTTLAINIFDHPYVVHHFDKRIWFTISQEYTVFDILVRLLNDGTDQEVTEAKLGEQLYKSLFGSDLIDYGNVLEDMKRTSSCNCCDWWATCKFQHGSTILEVCCEKCKTLEEVAKEYLKNLVERNLILIRKWTRRRKFKVCGIHDLLRDLCLKEADKEQFIRTPKIQQICDYGGKQNVCFLCNRPVSQQGTIDAYESGLVCEACKSMLLDPKETEDPIILENLQTLSFLYDFKCTKDVLQRIPNLRKLKICYFKNVEDWSSYCLFNIVHLHKLESLFVVARDLQVKDIAFPTSLKKLFLCECKIPWEDMTIIGSLLNLEVLILYHDAFKGSEWNPNEGQFPRLKVLSIMDSKLACWRAENIHFPNLESLSLQNMPALEEIPSSIGDVATLCLIRVYECQNSVVDSAKQILEEQRSNGNEDLQVLFYFSYV
ncbi:Disease resistance protein RGA2 [Sesamum angolense]|uniref:Disease resistance protein RGA2 n=1 Tax=Sesamum angolense TaxID=2727404 RepID=A0AAE1WJW0_9LAMI|nr:Disease resistance protein RGA2 [Sesamum angolense]